MLEAFLKSLQRRPTMIGSLGSSSKSSTPKISAQRSRSHLGDMDLVFLLMAFPPSLRMRKLHPLQRRIQDPRVTERIRLHCQLLLSLLNSGLVLLPSHSESHPSQHQHQWL